MSSRSASSGDAFLNIRARFERATSGEGRNFSLSRGSSPSGSAINGDGSCSQSPPRNRKIRTSFVAVEPSGQLRAAMSNGQGIGPGLTETKSGRRPSFSLTEEQDGEAIAMLKKTVSNEYERRKSIPGLKDNIVPESALISNVPTPIQEAQEPILSAEAARPSIGGRGASNLKSVVLPGKEVQTEHTEKQISALEDTAELNPGDMKDVATVTGGEGFNSKGNENTRSRTDANSKPKVTKTATSKSSTRPSLAKQDIEVSKPAATQSGAEGAKRSSRPSTYMNPTAASKASTSDGPKTPPARTSRPKSPTRPVELPAHLIAPTASFAAKHERELPAKKRVSSGSKPLEISSHLMAPTAASRAKHEPEPAPAVATKSSVSAPSATGKRDRTSNASSLGSGPNRKPVARTSLATRANGTSSSKPEPKSPTSKEPTPGFLERMAKPTAASSSRDQEKIEPKKPEPKVQPKQTIPERKKPTTIAKPPVSRPNGPDEKDSDTATPAPAVPIAKPAAVPVEPRNPVTHTIQQPSEPKLSTVSESSLATVAHGKAQPAVTTKPGLATAATDQIEKAWNPAALPMTPQREREEASLAAKSKPMVNSKAKADKVAARKSMMDTPEMAAENTIR